MNTTKKIHLIYHTHWDREWFLTSEYTNEWLTSLFNNLLKILEKNPDYKFILDGQTLIIEDLQEINPSLFDNIKKYIERNNLIIGPYYAQIDWRIVNPELILKNIEIGQNICKKFTGKINNIGWLMDNFGHISQSPQIHNLFGIDTLFLWRGVNKISSEFKWIGVDKTEIFVIFLYGGYRNLYALNKTPSIIDKRILNEVDKMQYQQTTNILGLDGYDLDTEPEVINKNQLKLFKDIDIIISTPLYYIKCVKDEIKDKNIPILEGELISGKYACVFPSTLSTRNYIKVLNNLIEFLFVNILQPLKAILKKEEIPEILWKEILKQQIHDNICGVGIDQIYKKMENTYKKLYFYAKEEINNLLNEVFQNFSNGIYCLNLNLYKYNYWDILNNKEININCDGIGIFPIKEINHSKILDNSIELDNFIWENEYFKIKINKKGEIIVNGNTLGTFIILEDKGDAYSSFEIEENKINLNEFVPKIILKQKGKFCCKLEYNIKKDIVLNSKKDKITIDLKVNIILNDSPLIRWNIELDTKGVEYKIKVGFIFKDNIQNIQPNMPFDISYRDKIDNDLLPNELEYPLNKILLAAREINTIKELPFQDFIIINNNSMICAKGIREYKIEEENKIYLTLRRSIEWIAKENIRDRKGDAGPTMYIPNARCEKKVVFEIGYIYLKKDKDFKKDEIIKKLYKWGNIFKISPLIIENIKEKNKNKEVGGKSFNLLPSLSLPLSTIFSKDNKIYMRIFNPFDFILKYNLQGKECFINPKKIEIIEITKNIMDKLENLYLKNKKYYKNKIKILNFPKWIIQKENKDIISIKEIEKLKEKSKQIENQLKQIENQLKSIDKDEKEYYLIKHKYKTLERKLLEIKLSIFLNINEDKEKIRKIGEKLNKVRGEKRVLDYIVELYK